MINIHIEPSDLCNNKCYYCVVSKGELPHLQRGGFLPLDIHNKFFEDLNVFINDFSCAPTVDKSIYLRYVGVGEPALHPDFISMRKSD